MALEEADRHKSAEPVSAAGVCAAVRRIWHILKHKTGYQELGADHFARRDPERALRRITKEANRPGLTVHFDPLELDQLKGCLSCQSRSDLEG